MIYLPSATRVLFSSSVRMTAVPEAAFLGWKEMREETEGVLDDGDEEGLLLQLFWGLDRWFFTEDEQEEEVDEEGERAPALQDNEEELGDEEGFTRPEEVEEAGDTDEEDAGDASLLSWEDTGRREDESERDPCCILCKELEDEVEDDEETEEEVEEVDPVGDKIELFEFLLFLLGFFLLLLVRPVVWFAKLFPNSCLITGRQVVDKEPSE